jgi:hypothetical protein
MSFRSVSPLHQLGQGQTDTADLPRIDQFTDHFMPGSILVTTTLWYFFLDSLL